MPRETHRAISKLIDNFIRDVVAGRDLKAGWALAGPDLRGGTTRAAWDRGTGVTVQRFSHVLGTYFGNAWDGKLVSPSRAELTVNVRIGGNDPQVIAEPTVVLKEHGRWVVDTMYTAGIFRGGSGHRGSCAHSRCAVTGVNDFAVASSGGHELGTLSPERGRWMWVGLGGVGVVLFGTLASLLLYTRFRDRRAMRAYETHMGRP